MCTHTPSPPKLPTGSPTFFLVRIMLLIRNKWITTIASRWPALMEITQISMTTMTINVRQTTVLVHLVSLPPMPQARTHLPSNPPPPRLMIRLEQDHTLLPPLPEHPFTVDIQLAERTLLQLCKDIRE